MLTGTIAPTAFVPNVDLTPAFAGMELALRGFLVAAGIAIAIVLLNLARRQGRTARSAAARDVVGLPTATASSREQAFAPSARARAARVRDAQLRSA